MDPGVEHRDDHHQHDYSDDVASDHDDRDEHESMLRVQVSGASLCQCSEFKSLTLDFVNAQSSSL